MPVKTHAEEGKMDEDDIDEHEDDVEILEQEEFDDEPGTGGFAGFLLGLAVGVVLGAGVAFLTVPERGQVTRHRLGRRLRDMGGDARDRAEDWRDEAARRLARQRKRIRRRLRSRR